MDGMNEGCCRKRPEDLTPSYRRRLESKRVKRAHLEGNQQRSSIIPSESRREAPDDEIILSNDQRELLFTREIDNAREVRHPDSPSFRIELAHDVGDSGTSDRNSVVSDSVDSQEKTFLDFKNKLADICVDISHVKTNAILKLLRTHSCFIALPKDARTLLGTPRITHPILDIAGGQYIDLSFQKAVIASLKKTPDNLIPNHLLIDFSTDGASLDKQSKLQIWPIQIKISNIHNSKPEICGIWMGPSKPKSAQQFFESFIDQVIDTLNHGGILYQNKTISIEIRCFIADAPARAFALNHVGHNGSVPCSRCYVSGKCIRPGVMVFQSTSIIHRNRQQYASYIDGSHHHEGECPLLTLIDPTTQVPFEYQHGLCHGLMEKSLQGWIDGHFSRQVKLLPADISIVKRRLELVATFCPSEFARKPVLIEKHGLFKDTEYRQLLAYTASVVFRAILHNAVYSHFLLLHCAVRICMNPYRPQNLLNFAQDACTEYVKNAPGIYGLEFLSYYAHTILHLVEDVSRFGDLDSFSAFPYENNMMFFKKEIRKNNQQLQQILNRRGEKSNRNKQSVIAPKSLKGSKPHQDGPFINLQSLNNFRQYKKFECQRFTVCLNGRDDTLILKDSTICVVQNIIEAEGNYSFIIKQFERIGGDFFEVGIPSSTVETFLCSRLSEELSIINFNEIKGKCFRMPYWHDNQPDPIPDVFVISTLFSTVEKVD